MVTAVMAMSHGSRKTLTLEELAKMAGVSRSTVSRVVNEEPNVRADVRERVWQVIEEVGYHPNAAARSLASRRSQTLGVVIPEAMSKVFADPFFGSVLQGIAETADAHKYHLMLSIVTRPLEEDFYRRALRSQMLDGVVVLSAPVDDPLIPRLQHDRLPFVVVGRYLHDNGINYVDTDNVQGARMAVEHLSRYGRRCIATVSGPLNMSPGQDRLAGYRAALREAGLGVDDRLIVEGDFSQMSGYIGAQKVLRQRPDAMFVASDLMAAGALRAIREAGLRVPEDIAMVGFDDAQIAAFTDPPLTTVRQPVYQLGVSAIEMLLHLIESEAHGPLRTILPTELVVRDSCGARAVPAK